MSQRSLSRGPLSRAVTGMAAIAFAVAGLAVALPTGASATPATVAGSCNQAGCNGLDPYATGCTSDQYVGATRTSDDGLTTVNLMYSPSCQAAWTEVWGGQPFSMIDVANNVFNYYTAYTDEWGNGHTPMVTDPGTTRSHGCYYPADGGLGTCTNAFLA
ncbi:DUF2690 domain-containing protein [Embleya sp. NBC_00896]|uniref:DUF2690 domain-containing protein n=1 Tax=Embleya sp. NBC_00896 TaxID=2975961 RepID=UPI00386BD300|nr:YjfA family protein [Embleya sp. NBC_00896]